MKSVTHNAIIEILMTGDPLTELETMNLFLCQNLTPIVGGLRKQGFVIEPERVAVEDVYKRLDKISRAKHPRPRYRDITDMKVTQWKRNRSKEARSRRDTI
jgi:hypothetical protein